MKNGRFIVSLISDAALAVMGGVLSAVALPWAAALLTSTGFALVAIIGVTTKYSANSEQLKRETEHAAALAQADAERQRLSELLESTSSMVSTLVEIRSLRAGALRTRIAATQQHLTRYFESRGPFQSKEQHSYAPNSYGASMTVYGEYMRWWALMAKEAWSQVGDELSEIQTMLSERGFADEELDQQIGYLKAGVTIFDLGKISARLAHVAAMLPGA